MGLFELLLLAVGLAMDAFAVSICKGLSAPKLTKKEYLLCGIWFGAFQGIMPFIGYLAGSGFERYISLIAPWLAFILLSLIGGNMIKEALSPEEEVKPGFDIKTMFLMAVATSIDALAVGITFVAVPVSILSTGKLTNVLLAVAVIGIITFVISMAGVRIGSLFGSRFRSGSEIMGGTILIFIGLRSLITHLDSSNTLGDSEVIFGMLIPLAGTLTGSAVIYARKEMLSKKIRTVLYVISYCIMFLIAVWGMLRHAMEGLSNDNTHGILPVAICFIAGLLFQFLLDKTVPHTHVYSDVTEGPRTALSAGVRVMLKEIIHHIPEGIALGAVYAAHFMKAQWISTSLAIIMAIALAIQNIPEAINVSLPLRDKGTGTGKAFFMGIVSGVPIPLLGIITVVIATLFPIALPYIMAVAGGALIYTIVEEIIHR
ncbi:MAG: manganese efflux pump [Clostridiales bacterium]|nr:manganese efflux pump [Clostridiales bacterium]